MPGGSEDDAAISEAMKRIGENVRRIRRDRGLSQDVLAKRAKVHRTQITLIETGRRQPGAETIIRLLGALEAAPNDLFRGVRWDADARDYVVQQREEFPRYIGD
jgi:transcriptional regulator with XRE-family HTH domain